MDAPKFAPARAAFWAATGILTLAFWTGLILGIEALARIAQ